LSLPHIKLPLRRYTAAGKLNIVALEGREKIIDPVTHLLRQGANELIELAIQAELEELLEKPIRSAAPRMAKWAWCAMDICHSDHCKPIWGQSQCASSRSGPRAESRSLTASH